MPPSSAPAKSRKTSAIARGGTCTASPDLHPQGRNHCFWWHALALAGLAAAAYIPSLFNGFIWDDDRFLYNNPLIHASDGLWRFWFSREAPDYFPLASTSLWIEWRLWGMRAAGYHATNVLLHAGTCVLLWRVFARLGVKAAWGAALLFALHPVNVESVAWITERKNTLSLFLAVASTLFFLRHEEHNRARDLLTACGLFALALLAKTSVAPLPAALVILAWWRRGSLEVRDMLRTAPAFFLALVFGLITVWFQYTVNIATEVVRTDSLLQRTLTAAWAVWFYLLKSWVPLGLCFVYPSPRLNPDAILSWAPAVALAGVAILLWARRGAWGRGPLAALALFVVLLTPVLGFLDIYFMRYALVSDHWQQIALPVVCAVAAVVGTNVLSRWPLAWRPVLGVAAVVLLILTLREQTAYRDEETLWRETLAKNPAAWIAHNNLGSLLEKRGRDGEAERHYREALRAWPAYREAHYNLANVLRRTRRPAEALVHYDEALRCDENYVPALNNSGTLLIELERAEEALARIERAIALRPGDAGGPANLASALAALGREKDAFAACERALALDPHHAGAWTTGGILHATAGRHEKAAEWFAKAVAANPGSGGAQFNLASALHLAGRPAEAVPHYRAALDLMPGNRQVMRFLAEALEETGHAEKALKLRATGNAAAEPGSD